MGRHSDIPNVLVILGVDDSNFSIVLSSISAAIPDINKLGMWLVNDAVRTRFKLDGVEQVQRVPLENPQQGVISARDEQFIELGNKQHALGLFESGDTVYPLPGL